MTESIKKTVKRIALYLYVLLKDAHNAVKAYRTKRTIDATKERAQKAREARAQKIRKIYEANAIFLFNWIRTRGNKLGIIMPNQPKDLMLYPIYNTDKVPKKCAFKINVSNTFDKIRTADNLFYDMLMEYPQAYKKTTIDIDECGLDYIITFNNPVHMTGDRLVFNCLNCTLQVLDRNGNVKRVIHEREPFYALNNGRFIKMIFRVENDNTNFYVSIFNSLILFVPRTNNFIPIGENIHII